MDVLLCLCALERKEELRKGAPLSQRHPMIIYAVSTPDILSPAQVHPVLPEHHLTDERTDTAYNEIMRLIKEG